MRSNCPLNAGLETFGDKWSLLLIRDLMFFGKRTYNEFLQSDEGISTTVLADRLAMLEKEGIVRVTKDKGHKQKLLYSLTEKGIDLLPVIIAIGLWSDKYFTGLNPDRDQLIGGARKNFTLEVERRKKKLKKAFLKK